MTARMGVQMEVGDPKQGIFIINYDTKERDSLYTGSAGKLNEEMMEERKLETKKWLKISFKSYGENDSKNMIAMPANYEAFMNALSSLYVIDKGDLLEFTLDEYIMNLQEEYEIILENGYVEVTVSPGNKKCVIS